MTRLILIVASILSVMAAPVQAQSPGYQELTWSDLLPDGEAANISRLMEMQARQSGFDHFGTSSMPQIQTFNTVDALDGQRVRIPGYVLPFDMTGPGEVTRFLLVPYVGACIHVPPPPPNQLVYVETDAAVELEGMWDPVYAEGVLHTRREDNDLGDAAYTLELTSLSPYRPGG
ncbi:DUF3299 domain-containing protein [Marinicauda sp. Alg238-R41]|uniref:DUF3299 domain-containing protein n=1 Tax=Marinicauda sp. Alg238-R41 TaxID=2993447 RepID=UPI0022E8D5D3|nr:DUF3299 domain-containing protein [Marinicauda sp. Alg238-R41]